MPVILVQNMRVTVTFITNVEKVLDVDQTIVWLYLDLTQIQIAAILQLLAQRSFVQLMNLVNSMKVTVILMMNAKVICFVGQTIVLIHLGIHLQLTAVNQEVIKHVQMTLDLSPQNCISQALAVSVPLVQQKQMKLGEPREIQYITPSINQNTSTGWLTRALTVNLTKLLTRPCKAYLLCMSTTQFRFFFQLY